jgi:hypothetical protein
VEEAADPLDHAHDSTRRCGFCLEPRYELARLAHAE